MLTAAEICNNYPNVCHSVAWCEAVICGKVDGVCCWDLLQGITLEERLRLIQELTNLEEPVSPVPPVYREKVKTQVKRSEFKTYLAGKMGLV